MAHNIYSHFFLFLHTESNMAANVARSLPKTTFISLNRPSLLEIQESFLSVSKQKQSNSEVSVWLWLLVTLAIVMDIPKKIIVR